MVKSLFKQSSPYSSSGTLDFLVAEILVGFQADCETAESVNWPNKTDAEISSVTVIAVLLNGWIPVVHCQLE